MIYFISKYSEEDCSSRGKLTDVIKYTALCRITGLASFRPRAAYNLTLSSLTRDVRNNEDTSTKFAYLVLRNVHRPNANLPNLPGTLDHDGNADINRSGGIKIPGTYCSR